MIEDPLPLQKARGFVCTLIKDQKKTGEKFAKSLGKKLSKMQKLFQRIAHPTQKHLAIAGFVGIAVILFTAVYQEQHVPIEVSSHEGSLAEAVRQDVLQSIDFRDLRGGTLDTLQLYREFAYVDASSGINHELEQELYAMVGDYPIKEMVPFIAREDRKVAAFIVGIAKKESNWGKYSPSTYENACYNYWGYRGAGSLGKTQSGYGCFSDPEEAIDVVGGRIHELAIDYARETPAEMIVWKCGSSCSGHSPESVSKWIQDVDIYYSRIVAFAS